MPATEEITIRVDPEAARIYREASEEERRKLDLLLSLRLTFVDRDPRTLEQVMDDISDHAEANGLTPEILESVLNEIRSQ